jgi:hypothetical protein
MSVKTWFIDLINAALPRTEGAPMREAAAGSTIDPDEEQWRRLTGNATRDLAPLTQMRMQRIAHFLWESNLLANRLIELPTAFLLAEGVKLLAKNDTDNQAALDRFWTDPINEMDLKLPKKVRELALFGEQCYPTFVNAQDGAVRLGYLDPALIETIVMDPDNSEQPIGVVTTKNKKGVARRYRVTINGPEEVFTQRTQGIRKTFGDGDAFYFRINDLSAGTRGRSDLLAQADWLDAYDQFMFGEVDRYAFLRAFVWDVTLTGATETEVKKRASEISPPRPNSVRVHNDSEKWDAVAPNLQAGDLANGARLFRNHVLGGASIPEHWFGGGGDVNRATASEMDTPTLKIYSMRQRFLKHMFESIGRYVLLKKAEAEGQTADFSKAEWKVEAEFPELAAGDTSKYAAAMQALVTAVGIAIDRKLITMVTAVRIINSAASQLGIELDPEQEIVDAQAEAAKAAENDVFTTPATGDVPAAGAAAVGAAAAGAAAG